MPGSAAKVIITERQQVILQDLVKSRTTPVRLAERATVVLRSFAGLDNADIAHEIALGPDAIGLWRRRWAKAWPRLNVFECVENSTDLRRAIAAVLDDKPRSGNPACCAVTTLTVDGRILLTLFSNTCWVGTTSAPVFWSKLYIWSYFSANGFIHS